MKEIKNLHRYLYLWLIHVDVWQKPTQHCKAIILQLKKSKQKKKNLHGTFLSVQWVRRHLAMQVTRFQSLVRERGSYIPWNN